MSKSKLSAYVLKKIKAYLDSKTNAELKVIYKRFKILYIIPSVLVISIFFIRMVLSEIYPDSKHLILVSSSILIVIPLLLFLQTILTVHKLEILDLIESNFKLPKFKYPIVHFEQLNPGTQGEILVSGEYFTDTFIRWSIYPDKINIWDFKSLFETEDVYTYANYIGGINNPYRIVATYMRTISKYSMFRVELEIKYSEEINELSIIIVEKDMHTGISYFIKNVIVIVKSLPQATNYVMSHPEHLIVNSSLGILNFYELLILNKHPMVIKEMNINLPKIHITIQ